MSVCSVKSVDVVGGGAARAGGFAVGAGSVEGSVVGGVAIVKGDREIAE
jgi:hypothetical protein